MTFKQLIEVRNTFDRRVRLMVVDQVPVSAEDKIKVRVSLLTFLTTKILSAFDPCFVFSYFFQNNSLYFLTPCQISII